MAAIRECLGENFDANALATEGQSGTTGGLDKDGNPIEESALAKARAELFAEGPQEAVKMRDEYLNFVRKLGAPESLEHLDELYRGVRFMGGRATLAGCEVISELTTAFEAVLFELIFKKMEFTDSILRTVAQAVDCLGRNLMSGEAPLVRWDAKPKVLVVDDDPIFNYATSNALRRARVDVTCSQSPVASLELMCTTRFDLVLLDINMPVMDGFQVCEQLRKIPGYEYTRVIFVTAHTDLKNRARSIVVGGNDLIGKPILPLELALIVTICISTPTAQAQAASPSMPSATSIVASELKMEANGLEAKPSEIPTAPKQDAREGKPDSVEPRIEVLEAEREQWHTRCGELETNLVALRQNHEELQAKHESAQTASCQRIETLEKKLSEATEEARRQADQLALATQSLKQTDTGRLELQDRSGKLEAELVTLRKSREELQSEYETAQAQSKQQLEALKQQLSESSTGSKAQLENLQTELAKAVALSKEAEATCQEWRSRYSQMESEIAATGRKAREEGRQQEEAESKRRIEALEKQLGESAAESKKQLEAIQAQLASVAAEKKQAESARQDIESRNSEVASELAALRKSREELQSRLESSKSQSSERIQTLEKQLGDSANESRKQMEDLRAQLAKATAVGTEAENQLEAIRKQLAGETAATKQAKAAGQGLEERCSKLESELATARKANDDAQAQSKQRIQDLEKQLTGGAAESRKQLETATSQLASATAANKQLESARQEWQTRHDKLVSELSATRDSHEDSEAKREKAQAESNKKIKALEKQLGESTTGSKKQLTELQAQLDSALESNRKLEKVQQQLAEAETSSKKSDVVRRELQERCGKLENELSSLRNTHTALQGKHDEVQVQSKQRTQELEKQLGASTADFKKQLDAANAQAASAATTNKQLEADRKEWQTRHDALVSELATARKAHADSAAKHEQELGQSGSKIKILEKQLGESDAGAKKQSVELQAQQESAAESKRRIEQLQKQLGEADSSSKQTDMIRRELQDRCAKLENELASLRKTHTALQGKHEETQAQSKQRTTELEKQLGASAADFKKQLEAMNAQVASATTASKQLEADRKEWQTRHGQLESELANGRKAQAELQSKHDEAQAQAKQRIQDLEKQIAGGAAEFKKQLDAANAQAANATNANKQLEADRQAWQKRHGDLESQLATGQKAQAELQSKHDEAQAQAKQRIQDLEKQLAGGSAEFKKQLDAANAEVANAATANKKLDSACQEWQTRHGRLVSELSAIRDAHADSEAKHEKAQTESRKQITAFEKQLSESAAGAKKQLAELQAQQQAAAELNKRIEQLQKQLTDATTASKQADATCQTLQERCGKLDTELAALRKTRETENAKTEQAQAESRKQITALEKQLTDSSATAKKQLAELQAQQKSGAEAYKRIQQLDQQLVDASAANKQAEKARQNLQERCGKLDNELTALRKTHEAEIVRHEQGQGELNNRIKGLEKQLADSGSDFKKQLAAVQAQLAEKTAAHKEMDANHQKAQTRCKEIESQLSAAQKAHAEKESKLEQTHAQSRDRIKGLEKQLSDDAASAQTRLTQLQTELTSAAESNKRFEKVKAESEAAIKAADATRRELEERCRKLSGELEAAQKTRAEEVAKHEEVLAQAKQRLDGLEKQLADHTTLLQPEIARMEQRVRQAVASLTSVTADFEKERAERQRVEQQAHTLSEKVEQLHTELGRTLATGREMQLKVANLADELRQRDEILGRMSDDLQQETIDRQLAEEQLGEIREEEAQLRQKLALSDQAERIYESSQGDLEAKLRAALNSMRENDAKLQQESSSHRKAAESLDSTRRELGDLVAKSQRLESQLADAVKKLGDVDSKLQSETRERQRLVDDLTMAQAQLRDQSERGEVEIAKLRSALELKQVEHKRFENYVSRLRRVSNDAARAGRTIRMEIRRQVRQPVDEICQSARQLLQAKLSAEHGKLVNQVLENALLAQASFRDDSVTHGNSTTAGAEGNLPADEK
jgi:chromosome segregation ATPase/DNA-binding response OmpR family regulator